VPQKRSALRARGNAKRNEDAATDLSSLPSLRSERCDLRLINYCDERIVTRKGSEIGRGFRAQSEIGSFIYLKRCGGFYVRTERERES